MSNQEVSPSVRHEHRPARGLVFRRAISANDYWRYCEEVGCEVWDQLSQLSGTLGEPMGLWLPESMIVPGISRYVMGVEVPLDYAEAIPGGFDLIPLPAQNYLILTGPPYEENVMSEAIGRAIASFDAFDPATMGWAWTQEAPLFQLAPVGSRGYIEGHPVVAN